jgi:hypothetical protein
MSTIQAIATKSYTESYTFTGVPSEALRKEMLAKGFKFKNGHWYRNQQESNIVDESAVANSLAA